jgi:hypothetical protein
MSFVGHLWQTPHGFFREKRRSSAALQNASIHDGGRKGGHVLECPSALALSIASGSAAHTSAGAPHLKLNS